MLGTHHQRGVALHQPRRRRLSMLRAPLRRRRLVVRCVVARSPRRLLRFVLPPLRLRAGAQRGRERPLRRPSAQFAESKKKNRLRERERKARTASAASAASAAAARASAAVTRASAAAMARSLVPCAGVQPDACAAAAAAAVAAASTAEMRSRVGDDSSKPLPARAGGGDARGGAAPICSRDAARVGRALPPSAASPCGDGARGGA